MCWFGSDGAARAPRVCSAFAFLFSELVQYWQSKVELTQDLEHRRVPRLPCAFS